MKEFGYAVYINRLRIAADSLADAYDIYETFKPAFNTVSLVDEITNEIIETNER